MNSRGATTFKRNGIGVTAPVLSDGLAHYTPSGEVRGGVKTTFHSALKNADVQTSSSGVVAASRVYDAFGNDLSVSGFWKSPFGYAGRFGYQQDADSGLKLLGHRYYDSDTGRFLTRDPIKDGPNWYTYCASDPLSHVDPEGLIQGAVLNLIMDPVYSITLAVDPGGRGNLGHAWIIIDDKLSNRATYGNWPGGNIRNQDYYDPIIYRTMVVHGEPVVFEDYEKPWNYLYHCADFAEEMWIKNTDEYLSVYLFHPVPYAQDWFKRNVIDIDPTDSPMGLYLKVQAANFVNPTDLEYRP